MDSSPSQKRAIGALLGLAVGDALGTTLEFQLRDQSPLHTEMVGGGAFELDPGVWTDDTSMALCLADSLCGNRRFDAKDVMDRYVRWWRNGENSPTGDCVDIGVTTSSALSDYERTGNPMSGPTDLYTSGNGSLMRLAPVPIFFHRQPEKAIEIAGLQSRTTHGSPEAVEACEFFANLLVEAFDGTKKKDLLRSRTWEGSESIEDIAGGSWKSKSRDQIWSSGYVIHTLEAAMWCVNGSNSFEEALITAVNLGHDADTVGAVTGQLAGALWSRDAIPERWLQALVWRDHIENLATELFRLGMSELLPR